MSEQKLWEKILHESSQTQRYPEGTLILVGKQGSGSKHLISALQRGPGSLGKSSLFTRLTSSEDTVPYSSPLLYSYINSKDISDPQSDKISKINIFGLEIPELKSLLEFALNTKSIDKTLFGIVLDWENPWRFTQDLESWVDIWHEMLGKVVSRLPLEDQDRLVKNVSEYIKSYREPDNATELSAEAQDLPLPEGVLQVNLGVPILVICCKSDLVWNLDKNRDQNEKILDMALKTLREFCVTYGASLFYTSSKSGANITTLYNYIMHRVYGFPFRQKPEIMVRDQIFIPAGWDSPSLIQQMDYLTGDKLFHDLLPRPKNRHVQKEEVKLTCDQEFLQQIKEKLENSRKNRREGVGIMLQKTNAPGDTPAPVVEHQPEAAPVGSQAKLQDFYAKLLQGRTNRDALDN